VSFAPFGQYPVAHGRPSVPCWLAGGSQAVSTPACEAGPSLDGLRPTAYSGQRVQRPSERASRFRPPSESQRTRVPSPGCPASPAFSRLHYQPGPGPGRASSTAPPGPPEVDPDQGPRLRHTGLRAPAHKYASHMACKPRGTDSDFANLTAARTGTDLDSPCCQGNRPHWTYR
jgi:hypothetical protein